MAGVTREGGSGDPFSFRITFGRAQGFDVMMEDQTFFSY